MGTVLYNPAHTYVFPLSLILSGILLDASPLLLKVGSVRCAHIGLDRFMGFGLKYPTDFKDTHLHRVT